MAELGDVVKQSYLHIAEFKYFVKTQGSMVFGCFNLNLTTDISTLKAQNLEHSRTIELGIKRLIKCRFGQMSIASASASEHKGMSGYKDVSRCKGASGYKGASWCKSANGHKGMSGYSLLYIPHQSPSILPTTHKNARG